MGIALRQFLNIRYPIRRSLLVNYSLTFVWSLTFINNDPYKERRWWAQLGNPYQSWGYPLTIKVNYKGYPLLYSKDPNEILVNIEWLKDPLLILIGQSIKLTLVNQYHLYYNKWYRIDLLYLDQSSLINGYFLRSITFSLFISPSFGLYRWKPVRPSTAFHFSPGASLKMKLEANRQQTLHINEVILWYLLVMSFVLYM